MKIKQMDTTKAGLRKNYLEPAAEKTKESFHAGSSMKRAAFMFFCDMIGLAVGTQERAEAAKQWDATPGWFACGNNSACRQAYESKGPEETLADYTNY